MFEQSIWRATARPVIFPRLEGSLSVDVAIVGAGITGGLALQANSDFEWYVLEANDPSLFPDERDQARREVVTAADRGGDEPYRAGGIILRARGARCRKAAERKQAGRRAAARSKRRSLFHRRLRKQVK